jgi:hypothetical protein
MLVSTVSSSHERRPIPQNIPDDSHLHIHWRENSKFQLLLLLFASSAPNAPAVIPEECSAENNSVTVAWQPPPTSYVEGYVLELDDGSGGEFRVSSHRAVPIPVAARSKA